MSDKTVEITGDNFEAEVLQHDTPVLIDFGAAWCGPCRMISPIIDEIAAEYEGRVKVGKLDVDAQGDVASRYNVRSIPTLLVFRNGQVVEQMVGAASREAIVKMIEKALPAIA